MRRLAIFALLFGLLAGCKTSNVASSSESASDATKDEAAFKTFEEVLKDTEEIAGFFDTHLKRDNTLYLEITPDRFDEEFGLIMHFSRGVGVFNIHDGLPLSGTRLMRLERHGDKVYLVHVNALFTADAGTPMRASLDDNTGHSIVAAMEIAAEDTASKAVLVDLTSLIVSDYAGISRRLKSYFDDKSAPFDKDRSYVSAVKGFPKNVEIDALLTYKGPEPPADPSPGVSDHRSIPAGVRYSIFALPEVPMQPRLADQRVGHLLTTVRDFSRDTEPSPYVHYVDRWRLEKKDHSAERSEPVKPIIYYVDRSVPDEYRPYVREGIEAWNKAFDEAGYVGGIVAMDPPDDPNWSAEDVRYSTVRWTAAHSMGYAIGPSQTDPRTGEILNADVLISSSFVTSWGREYRRLIAPQALLDGHAEEAGLAVGLREHLGTRMCLASIGKADELALQYTAMVGLGVLAPGAPMPIEHIGDMIRDLIMHEVGHTLGLRHNFKSSSAIPNDRLNDREYTRENGLASSVMDYNASNIAADPDAQGYYVNPEVGAYDVWAIQYAYAPVYEQSETGPFETNGTPAGSPEAELKGLSKVASRASEPLLVYNTDEDAHQGALAVDPLSNTWDLGSDPMAYAIERSALVDRIEPAIEDRVVASGDDYFGLRSAYDRLLFERYRSVVPVTKMVGGLYFSRALRDDSNGRPPFTPVSAEKQREAATFISERLFAESAFDFDPDLLNKLAPYRYRDWTGDASDTPIDFPVHDVLAGRQRTVLNLLLANDRLARMVDNTVRMPEGAEAFTVAELFTLLTGEIWTEVAQSSNPRSVSSLRRNLQRAHLDRMVDILLGVKAGSSSRDTPEDARSLARLELQELSDRLSTATNSRGLDRTTRAHFLESQARIEKALDQSVSRSVN